jgi:hypothetical protein
MEMGVTGDVHENEVSIIQWPDKCYDKKAENVTGLKCGNLEVSLKMFL